MREWYAHLGKGGLDIGVESCVGRWHRYIDAFGRIALGWVGCILNGMEWICGYVSAWFFLMLRPPCLTDMLVNAVLVSLEVSCFLDFSLQPLPGRSSSIGNDLDFS
jgi:hypothetical protein